MVKKFLVGGLGSVLISLVSAQAASAADMAPLPSVEPIMSGDMTIYGWYSIVGGDVGVNGFGPAEIPESSGSILDVLDGFFMANGSLRYGDWGLFGDVVWADLGKGNSSANGFLNAESSLSALVGTAALTYTLIDTPDSHLDALAGARLWSVDVGLDLTGGGPLPDVDEDRNLSWVDPLVGLRVVTRFPRASFSPAQGLSVASALDLISCGMPRPRLAIVLMITSRPRLAIAPLVLTTRIMATLSILLPTVR